MNEATGVHVAVPITVVAVLGAFYLYLWVRRIWGNPSKPQE